MFQVYFQSYIWFHCYLSAITQWVFPYLLVINVWTIDALKSKSQKKISSSTQSLEVVTNVKHSSKQIHAGHEGRYIPNTAAVPVTDSGSAHNHLIKPDQGHPVSWKCCSQKNYLTQGTRNAMLAITFCFSALNGLLIRLVLGMLYICIMYGHIFFFHFICLLVGWMNAF